MKDCLPAIDSVAVLAYVAERSVMAGSIGPKHGQTVVAADDVFSEMGGQGGVLSLVGLTLG